MELKMFFFVKKMKLASAQKRYIFGTNLELMGL